MADARARDESSSSDSDSTMHSAAEHPDETKQVAGKTHRPSRPPKRLKQRKLFPSLTPKPQRLLRSSSRSCSSVSRERTSMPIIQESTSPKALLSPLKLPAQSSIQLQSSKPDSEPSSPVEKVSLSPVSTVKKSSLSPASPDLSDTDTVPFDPDSIVYCMATNLFVDTEPPLSKSTKSNLVLMLQAVDQLHRNRVKILQDELQRVRAQNEQERLDSAAITSQQLSDLKNQLVSSEESLSIAKDQIQQLQAEVEDLRVKISSHSSPDSQLQFLVKEVADIKTLLEQPPPQQKQHSTQAAPFSTTQGPKRHLTTLMVKSNKITPSSIQKQVTAIPCPKNAQITKMRPAGNVLEIRLASEKDKHILKEHLQKNVFKDKETAVVEDKHPPSDKIILFSVPEAASPQQVIDGIFPGAMLTPADYHITRKIPARKAHHIHIVITVPKHLAQLAIEGQHFYLGYNRYRIQKYTAYKRCFHCQTIGHHYSYQCPNKKCCMFCAENHAESDCPRTRTRCINCWDHNYRDEKREDQWSIDHPANDKNCRAFRSYYNLPNPRTCWTSFSCFRSLN